MQMAVASFTHRYEMDRMQWEQTELHLQEQLEYHQQILQEQQEQIEDQQNQILYLQNQQNNTPESSIAQEVPNVHFDIEFESFNNVTGDAQTDDIAEAHSNIIQDYYNKPVASTSRAFSVSDNVEMIDAGQRRLVPRGQLLRDFYDGESSSTEEPSSESFHQIDDEGQNGYRITFNEFNPQNNLDRTANESKLSKTYIIFLLILFYNIIFTFKYFDDG